MAKLFVAAYEGKDECVKLLLAHPSGNVNATDDFGCSLLYISPEQGFTNIVKLLLGYSSVNIHTASFNGVTPLIVTAHSGTLECVDLLLMDDVFTLMEHYPNLFQGIVLTSILCNAQVPRALSIELWLFIFSFLRHANVNGAVFKNEEIMQYDLPTGATALWMAASQDHVACVERLLAYTDILVNQPDAAGLTPLAVAQKNGHDACVALLLSGTFSRGNAARWSRKGCFQICF